METAKDKLKKMTAWDTEPALDDDEIDELLMQSSLADVDGLAPDAPEWKETYDLSAAASAGWLIKAGRASTLVEIEPPGSGITTSKVFENCRRMAKYYAEKRAGTSGFAKAAD